MVIAEGGPDGADLNPFVQSLSEAEQAKVTSPDHTWIISPPSCFGLCLFGAVGPTKFARAASCHHTLQLQRRQA